MSNAEAEIKKVWRILAVDNDSVLELRALRPKGWDGLQPSVVQHFRGTDYADVEGLKAAFENAALTFNALGYNAYMVMNPIRLDFKGPVAAKDVDIECRTRLLVDVDRKGDTSCPANQAEIDAARAMAYQIKAYLATRGWKDPVIMMSGNGFHLYYVLDRLPNNDESTKLVRTTLLKLASTFSNQIVGIDTIVYNASRITKIPGTIMRKGMETDDRPYRMAEVCDEV